MARNRTISPDFWTWEAVIDCQPMTRLLFIGLWNFADDYGVQPLRPRTIRMQVLPGEELDSDAVRRMIDELAAQRLVRIYEVDGQEYVAIADWHQLQRVGKRARRRYPAAASPLPGVGQAGEPPSPPTIETHSNGQTPRSPPFGEPDAPPPQTMANHSNGDALPFGAAGEPPSPTIANHSNADHPAAGEAVGQPSPTIANHCTQPNLPPADRRELDARLRRIATPA
ncbi:MAG: hypothetical protein KF889_14695 [Alphaproteobacteria bacterium]|nr:hypothetical protein [Alphaproteobacteria bacterium]MCW5738752.1 hypothetical protein [Alphaproteobacteria bacterium]